ncbi:MAG: 1-aminocyclopropane-1-carboxylate deaminase [Epsilonproteobacteria bacterium]|nr:1-aminocyclopropane-1-carboxylate deaminase [Campylobacterota bacterium]
MQPTPISKISLDGRDFLIKRDDLYDRFLAGNKYRKLYKLLQTPKERYNKIISYGGTQSNAMLALAALCKQKGWEFTYYTKPLSKQLLKLPYGNFAKALELGMCHIALEEELYRGFIASLRLELDAQTLVVDQGGANPIAQEGLELLAKEVMEQKELLDLHNITAFATPSGTGTTALFLARALPRYTIYTTPSVADAAYLRLQMLALCDTLPPNLHILKPKKKYHFAKPYREFYELYHKLLQSGVEFDLLYAPLLWQELLDQTTENILYIHSGGITGNDSMLQRYARKGFAT